jgi:hypothetical protein
MTLALSRAFCGRGCPTGRVRDKWQAGWGCRAQTKCQTLFPRPYVFTKTPTISTCAVHLNWSTGVTCKSL